MIVRTHSSAQLVLLAAVAAFIGILTLIAILLQGRILPLALISLLIPLALLWTLWLSSAVGWVKGVIIRIDEGGVDERSRDHGIRRLLVP